MRASSLTIAGLLFGGLCLAGLAWAQQANQPRDLPMPTPQPQVESPRTLPVPMRYTVKNDYAAMYKQEQQKNQQLTAENRSLEQRLAQMTHPGGSLVHAYCDATDRYSRNTAGAKSDCYATHLTCESVSGLCRTSCQRSDDCEPGYICDTYDRRCKTGR